MRVKPIAGANLDEVFEAIAEEAILAAEKVECSKERFVEGLKDMEMSLKDRRLLMQSEIDADDQAADDDDD